MFSMEPHEVPKEEYEDINIVVIGNVGSGKSTTVGQLLYRSGFPPRDEFEELEKVAKEAGKSSLKYAWIVDKLKDERERGSTIEFSTQNFCKPPKTLTFIHTPGNKDFIKNMINGISLADGAILVVSAATGEFEASMGENGKTKEHVMLAHSLGVRELIVAVNKMDQTEPPYSEARFNEVVGSISEYIETVGYRPKEIPFVPISGFENCNVVQRSYELRWFDGWEKDIYREFASGVTLQQAIDCMIIPRRSTHLPLRVNILNVDKSKGEEAYVTGQVLTGVIKPDTTLKFTPGSLTAAIHNLEYQHVPVGKGYPGKHVSFTVKGKSVQEICAGFVAGDTKNDPPKEVKSFTAKVLLTGDPGEIQAGYTVVVDCHITHVVCKFVEFIQTCDRRTGRKVEDKPKSLKSGEAAIVKLVPTEPMCVESAREYLPLSRFIMRDASQIVGIGMVMSTEKAT